ncbi:MAG: hypothetical protein LBD67_04220 [Candidatus Accumulibacter sp.]|jgi:hypothetical protein|nr:hypothetical protein [Accumulibacter sp.]
MRIRRWANSRVSIFILIKDKKTKYLPTVSITSGRREKSASQPVRVIIPLKRQGFQAKPVQPVSGGGRITETDEFQRNIFQNGSMKGRFLCAIHAEINIKITGVPTKYDVLKLFYQDKKSFRVHV